MYYEEKVVNGRLCWRDTPKGEFIEFSTAVLTQRLMAAEHLASAAPSLLAVVRDFVSDVDAAYQTRSERWSLEDEWFDLSVTYTKAQNLLDELGV